MRNLIENLFFAAGSTLIRTWPLPGYKVSMVRADGRLIGQCEAGRTGVIEIDDHAVGIGGPGEGGDERHAARAAREAAMAVERAAVRLLAFHLHVVAPGRAVAALRAEQLVEHDVFELLGEPRFARQPQQLRVELQPGHGDAGLADVVDVGQIEIAVEDFAVTGRAGDVEAVA